MNRTKKTIAAVALIVVGYGFNATAGIGDGAGPFDNSNNSTTQNNSIFSNGSSSTSSSPVFDGEEHIFDNPPDGSGPPGNPPPPTVPLDGGAIMVLSLGAVIGFSRIVKNRLNVFAQQ
jgi:hypothetical protein